MAKTGTHQYKILRELYIALRVSGVEAAVAYRQAGGAPKWADRACVRLEHDPYVSGEIQKRLQKIVDKLGVTGEHVIAELKHIAFADLRNVLSVEGGSVAITDSADWADSDARTISEASSKETKFGTTISIKQHDKIRALELLGKYLKLWDKQASGEKDDPLHLVITVKRGNPLLDNAKNS
jgi:phage terminase small subunit